MTTPRLRYPSNKNIGTLKTPKLPNTVNPNNRPSVIHNQNKELLLLSMAQAYTKAARDAAANAARAG